MPIYCYACMNEDCPEMGKVIDVLRSLSDETVEVCGVCGWDLSPTIPQSVGIAFKGTGFYCTDY